MWRKLTGKRPDAATPAALPDCPVARTPADTRIYAIGDVHGRADLLDDMARKIDAHLKSEPIADAKTVFLGDYVDRGPRSRQVIERLAARDFPTPFVALRGNHEQMMLNFLSDPRYLGTWRQFGGFEALHSFDIDLRDARDGRGYKTVHAEFIDALQPESRSFLESTPSSYQCGDYFFCHAGVRPNTSLQSQLDKDLLWIREDFLSSPVYHGKVIVHGHTPVGSPDVRPNRINIDTGAYVSGHLTCLVLEGEGRRFLST